MQVISLHTLIQAPKKRCFDLARSIDLHVASSADSKEKAIFGITQGLIELGQKVTFSAKHFGFHFTLTSQITDFQSPDYFQDTMIKGPFSFMQHDHFFERTNTGTMMIDCFMYTLPMNILGKLVDILFIQRHLFQFLSHRNQIIKETAESEQWRFYLK